MSTVFPVTRRLTAGTPRILVYHRFGPMGLDAAVFEEQVRILKNCFNIVSLSALSAMLRQRSPLPDDTVVITVDDGYADFYQYAFPVLKKYSVPATLYAVSDFIDRKIWLWPDMIAFTLDTTNRAECVVQLGEKTCQFGLGTAQERHRAWNDIADHCLLLRDREKHRFIREMAQDLGVTIPQSPVEKYAAVTWDNIAEMMRHGIDIGSHTCTHPRLTMVDRDDLEHELGDSKRRIEEMTGAPVESFCYPNGSRVDYDEEIKRKVQSLGYTDATVGFHDSRVTDDLYALRRYGMGPDMFHFRKAINGFQLWWCRVHG